jgi:CYTH domain-containing protein
MAAKVEIERKFLLHRLPDGLAAAPRSSIAQGYLCCDADHEVRLRRRDGRHLQTVKGLGDLARKEIEVEIDAAVFAALWPATEGRRVEKTRYAVRHGGLTIEVDLYHGSLDGLVTAEVEFASEAMARAFEPPPWMAAEITADRRYKNRNLAVHGLPGEHPG